MKKTIERYWLISLVLLAGLVSAEFTRTGARAKADWPQISLVKVTGGFESPVHLTHADDGSGRLFVVEQGGRIRIVKNSTITTTFLDISDRVRSPSSGGGGEEGLLSAAFPPGYGTSKDYFYVYYTNLDGNNQVARFHLGTGPDTADPGSEELILLLEHPGHQNHNGGQLFFGPDGYLYIGTGDGGGGGDPQGNAQNPTSLLGKLLRIDVELEDASRFSGNHLVYLPTLMKDSTGTPIHQRYAIPPDNPFVGKPGYRGEIWALGLRNPWRFSFDRLTGDLYIGDVGQNAWEEVDFQPASSAGGENYGWNILEGFACYLTPNCDKTGLTLPVLAYSHDNEKNCSITGGYTYRGQELQQLRGIYLFGDYCSGSIWGLQKTGQQWISQQLLQSPYNISSFGEDQAGELYLVDRGKGEIYKVAP